MFEPGTPLPDFKKRFHAYDLMAYGAATWDWYDVHYDRATAEAAGLPGPFVDGQQFGALFARQIRQFFGDQCFLAAMDLRFHALVHAGDLVTGRGAILSVPDPTGCEVRQDLFCNERLVASAQSRVDFNFPGQLEKEPA
jgi:acyl dehydratase